MSSDFVGTVDYELIPGDANCDGLFNVLDVITTANYFVGNQPHPFCFENADVNGDGAIYVMDIILTIDIFLGDLKTYHLHLEASPDEAGTITGAANYTLGEIAPPLPQHPMKAMSLKNGQNMANQYRIMPFMASK